MLAIGAGLLAIPYGIILIIIILFSHDWIGALSVASPGIFAVITLLLALYDKSKYENSVN